MELRPREADLFAAYLAPFLALTGDRRTATLLGETIRDMLGSERLVCAKIAAFPPWAGRRPAR